MTVIFYSWGCTPREFALQTSLPAYAGMTGWAGVWIPACAGMTVGGGFNPPLPPYMSADRMGVMWFCGGRGVGLGVPVLMGVVNVTPDSFSDGGRYCSVDDAVDCGVRMVEDGAGIVDVGGESTRPGAAVVSVDEEMRRVLPVVERLAARGVVVSVDTRKVEVMRAALDAGAVVVNDVGGMGDDAARRVVADSDCGVIIMHMRGNPQTMQAMTDYDDVAAEVGGFLRRRVRALVDDGVDRGRLCVDPGVGFGKTLAQNWRMLRALPQMVGEGLPIMVGVSRKSLFAGIEKNAARRDGVSATLAALLYARGGANVFRVHNVKATRAALDVVAALEGLGENNDGD